MNHRGAAETHFGTEDYLALRAKFGAVDTYVWSLGGCYAAVTELEAQGTTCVTDLFGYAPDILEGATLCDFCCYTCHMLGQSCTTPAPTPAPPPPLSECELGCMENL